MLFQNAFIAADKLFLFSVLIEKMSKDEAFGFLFAARFLLTEIHYMVFVGILKFVAGEEFYLSNLLFFSAMLMISSNFFCYYLRSKGFDLHKSVYILLYIFIAAFIDVYVFRTKLMYAYGKLNFFGF